MCSFEILEPAIDEYCLFSANALRDDGSDVDEMDQKRNEMKKRIEDLIEPLSRRKQMLEASKQLHQFYR